MPQFKWASIEETKLITPTGIENILGRVNIVSIIQSSLEIRSSWPFCVNI